MPLEFHVTFTITSADDAEMLAAIEWVKDNHGAKIYEAEAVGETKNFTVDLLEASYNDSVTTITAFKTQFTVRIGDMWGLRTAFVA